MVDPDFFKAMAHNSLAARSLSADGKYVAAVNMFTYVINKMEEEDLSDDYESRMLLAGAYLRRGMAKHNLGDYLEAIEDYSVANIKYGDLVREGLFWVFINCAETLLSRSYSYLKIGEYEESLYEEALKDSESVIDIYGVVGIKKGSELEWNLARAYTIRGVAQRKLELYEKSHESLQKAIELLKELYKTKNDDRIGRDLILAYVDMGNLMEDIKDYDKAMEYYNKGKELLEHIYTPGVLWVYDDFSTPYHTRTIIIPDQIGEEGDE